MVGLVGHLLFKTRAWRCSYSGADRQIMFSVMEPCDLLVAVDTIVCTFFGHIHRHLLHAILAYCDANPVQVQIRSSVGNFDRAACCFCKSSPIPLHDNRDSLPMSRGVARRLIAARRVPTPGCRLVADVRCPAVRCITTCRAYAPTIAALFFLRQGLHLIAPRSDVRARRT